MSAVRYETYCGGRLRKVIMQVEVPDFDGPPYPTAEAAAEATARWRASNDVPVADGEFWWLLDGRQVSPDVAARMLAEAG
jgi:hypothetical protein